MIIAGLQKVSLIDYPDRVAASVFLAGCNLNCGYCYNRWMIHAPDVAEATSTEELIAWLRTRTQLLDGVCVTGGEPTIHASLLGLLRSIKETGLAVKLDTNGTNPACLCTLLQEHLIDYAALDIKAPLDQRYSEVAGCIVDLGAIRESISVLRSGAPAYEFRTTAGPELDEQALREMAKEVRREEQWFLQPFQVTPEVELTLCAGEALSEDELLALAEELSASVPRVHVRGL